MIDIVLHYKHKFILGDIVLPELFLKKMEEGKVGRTYHFLSFGCKEKIMKKKKIDVRLLKFSLFY